MVKVDQNYKKMSTQKIAEKIEKARKIYKNGEKLTKIDKQMGKWILIIEWSWKILFKSKRAQKSVHKCKGEII